MKKWQIEKSGLTKAYVNEPISPDMLKYVPSRIFESPKGQYALYYYGEKEIAKEESVLNFMILQDPYHPNILFKSDKTSVYVWLSWNRIKQSWSEDERYAGISVAVILGRGAQEAILIIDVKRNIFTLIPLAGAQDYSAKFLLKRRISISYSGNDPESTYYEVFYDKKEYLSRFKWLPLDEFPKASRLYGSGYFGNLLGHKSKKYNVHFKHGFDQWPYAEKD